MFLKKEHQNKLLQDLKTVNDQHLSMGRNLGVYYYITSNHKEKNYKTLVPKNSKTSRYKRYQNKKKKLNSLAL